MLTTILLTFVLTLLSCYAGWRAHEWSLRHRTVEVGPIGTRRCGICQKALPEKAIKSVSGWRCAEHKAVA